jgi:hypothetical protein
MSALLNYYIDISKSPLNSLVQSTNSTTPQNLNNVAILGDLITIGLVFTNNGAIDIGLSGVAGTRLTASIGSVTEGVLVQNVNWYVSSSYGFTGSLNYGDNRLTASMSTSANKTYTLSVKANDKTYVYSPIIVYNDI